MTHPLLQLGAGELAGELARGAVRAVEVAEACLDEIGRREPEIGAWAWLDGQQVLDQARSLDEYRSTGRPIGPLHGLPVGIKDIFDTAGIPTENGSPIDSGRVPTDDAAVVARLKQAGALIVGKTVTTELAFRSPGKTRNPHNPAHTPGGSSSGSTAAVAAGMVPLAIGTQTAGSVIRPASFCGVVGFKPTFGAISRTGILSQSPTLDTVGVFARSVEDAALLADSLFGYDAYDQATKPGPAPRLFDIATAQPPVKPALAFVRQPDWKRADQEMREAFEELESELKDLGDEVELPSVFNEAVRLHGIVQIAELAKAYHRYESRGRDRLSPAMREAIDQGRGILAHDYLAARDWPAILNAALDAIFERYDVIVTQAALGPAPQGLDHTGDPVFDSIWTFCGTPAVTLPLFQAASGLPMGVQLVGRRGDDARLLRTARWLAGHLSATA